jgi:hypothetical protein
MGLVGTASADDKGKTPDKPKAPAMSDADMIKLASKAAPPEITKGATFMTMGMDMKARQLKAGTNGWMCMAAMMGPKPEDRPDDGRAVGDVEGHQVRAHHGARAADAEAAGAAQGEVIWR